MRKLLGAIIVGTFVFGAVFASASSLPLAPNTGALQASNLISVTCQTDPVHIAYTTQLNGQGINEVKKVTLSGFDGPCYGNQAEISLFQADPSTDSLGSAGHMVWYAWGTINAASVTLDIASGSTPALPPVTDVQYASVMVSSQ